MTRFPRPRARKLAVALATTAAAALAAPAAGLAQSELPAAPDCQITAAGGMRTCASFNQGPSNYRGVMMIIAGGGWLSNNKFANGQDDNTLGLSDVWTAKGWATVTVEHTSAVVGSTKYLGPDGFADVVQWYKRIRAAMDSTLGGIGKPLCAFGQSSSGHLALMLMRNQSTLDCAVVEGTPTNLNSLPEASLPGKRAANAFKTAAIREHYSPALTPSSYAGRRILMGHNEGDDIVGIGQFNQFDAVQGVTKKKLVDGGVCSAAAQEVTSNWFRFAHLCQDDEDFSPNKEPRWLADGELARWRTAERDLADELGVGLP